jgi:hypothetical protein
MNIQEFKKNLTEGILLTHLDENELIYETMTYHNAGYNSETNKKLLFSENEYNNENDFKDDERIFFHSACTVPRFKVKMYTENNKCKVVRNADKATALIFSDDGILNEVIESKYFYRFNSNDFKSIINDIFGIYSPKSMKLLNELNKSNKTVYFNYNIKELLLNSIKSRNLWEKVKYDYSSDSLQIINMSLLSHYENLFKNKKLFHQNVILDKISTEVIMNKEMFDETCKMFDSVDAENTELALELMANCNYKKSAAFLLCLFTTYKNKIKNSKSKNHVNVKSMFEFFDINYNEYYDIEDILKKLEEKNCFTKEQLEFLVPGMKKEAEDRLSELGHYFTIELKLKDEILKKVKTDDNEKTLEEETIIDEEEGL